MLNIAETQSCRCDSLNMITLLLGATSERCLCLVREHMGCYFTCYSGMTVCVYIDRTRWKCYFLSYKIFWNYFLGEPGTILWGKRFFSQNRQKHGLRGIHLGCERCVFISLPCPSLVEPSFSVVGRHPQQNSLNFHSELFYFIKITECSLKQGYKLRFSQIPSECLTCPSSFWTAEFPCLFCLMNVLLMAKKPTQYSFGLFTTYQAPWFKYLCEKTKLSPLAVLTTSHWFFVYLVFSPAFQFWKVALLRS